MLNEYLLYLKSLNRSENTIKSYQHDLLQFADMIGKSWNQVEKADIYLCLQKLEKKGVSPASKARKITALQMFFSYLVEVGYITSNPTSNIQKPKIPLKQKKIIADDEVKLILSAALKDNMHGFRNMTMIYFMLSTGLRRNELVNVKIDDIDMETSSVIVKEGKGNKQRIVYFNDTAKSLLTEYISAHRIKFNTCNSEYLFVSERSEKLGLCTVNEIVNKAFEEAGVNEKGYTVHSLRKYFATTAYKISKDLTAVQELLGHSSPTTTMRYVGVEELTKRRVATALNF